MSPHPQAMYDCSHLLLLHRVAVFRIIELSTLECYGVAFLHKDSSYGKIRGIRLNFEGLCVVRKSEDRFLQNCLLQLLECSLALFEPMPYFVFLNISVKGVALAE